MLTLTLLITDILLVLLIMTLYKRRPKEKEEPKPIKVKHYKDIPETEEERRYKQIMDNLESYDGSKKGQVKV